MIDLRQFLFIIQKVISIKKKVGKSFIDPFFLAAKDEQSSHY